jgi:tagaturonate reductase
VTRPKLAARLLEGGHRFPPGLAVTRPEQLPERVLQFGEGNFLRAFVDWMIDSMNARGLFRGRAVLVQPISSGLGDTINAQDGLYTVLLRGNQDGEVREERRIVSAVSRCVSPYADFDAFLSCARNPDLRFIVSNTTEAGIKTDPADRFDARPAQSFPGKLTQLLHARFTHFGGDPARGLVLLPCELIENNGTELRRAVLETARAWNLSADFQRFVGEACLFTNTLVDRIVTGYPRDEIDALGDALGYDDALLVAGEIFHSWVIATPRPLDDELPLRAAGLNVTFTHELRPYRERKVRILNGAHTMAALAAFLAGHDTVRACVQDPLFFRYIDRGIHEEILPTLELPRLELTDFAGSVLERFNNPFIRHYLASIALNSVSKYKARILPTVVDYVRARGSLPRRLTFALAALIAFYRGQKLENGALLAERDGVPYSIQDDAPVLEFFAEAWSRAAPPYTPEFCADLVRRTLARSDFWGRDLNTELSGFSEAVAGHLHAIMSAGVRSALERVAA